MLTSVVNCTDGRVPVNCKNCTICKNCALPRVPGTGYRVYPYLATHAHQLLHIHVNHFAALVMLHRLLHNAMHVVGHTHVGVLKF